MGAEVEFGGVLNRQDGGVGSTAFDRWLDVTGQDPSRFNPSIRPEFIQPLQRRFVSAPLQHTGVRLTH